MQTIDAGIYWLIPGPKAFVNRIATDIVRVRVMVLNLPTSPVPGTLEGITKGLSEAHLDPVIHLAVRGSTDIAADVGVHFGDGRRRITAPELARIQSLSPRALLLLPQDEAGQALCDTYTAEFMNATKDSQGNVHLVTLIHDPNLKEDGRQGDIQVITFDGGLTRDEMEAYVGLRMAQRYGPGSTRLLRAIVSEFAGFDAEFAERLMNLDDGLILRIRDHLSVLMDEDPNRWRTLNWLSGTESIVSKEAHVLHERYMSEHGVSWQKEMAQANIDRLYWRACLKTITPWIEERRMEVVRPFIPQLRANASKSAEGKIEIPVGKYSKFIDPEEIEFNNIPAMVKYGELRSETPEQRNAVSICSLVKPVRDDIAHLRPPREDRILALVHSMDGFVKT